MRHARSGPPPSSTGASRGARRLVRRTRHAVSSAHGSTSCSRANPVIVRNRDADVTGQAETGAVTHDDAPRRESLAQTRGLDQQPRSIRRQRRVAALAAAASASSTRRLADRVAPRRRGRRARATPGSSASANAVHRPGRLAAREPRDVVGEHVAEPQARAGEHLRERADDDGGFVAASPRPRRQTDRTPRPTRRRYRAGRASSPLGLWGLLRQRSGPSGTRVQRELGLGQRRIRRAHARRA